MRSKVSQTSRRSGQVHRFVGVIALSLSACSNVPSTQVADLQGQLRERNKTIASLQRDLAAEKALVAAMRNVEAAEVRARQSTPPVATPANDEPATQAVAMCFKDYCPCDPPQGGPDTVLCDQLEAGIEPDIQSMIAGRGMREARRQLADMGY